MTDCGPNLEPNMTTNELADLGERLKGSLAINTLSQTIIKLDVAIEGLQRLMDDVKKLKEKLEEYK
jgi:hypothetical protein